MKREKFIIFRVSARLRDAFLTYAKQHNYKNVSDLGRIAISNMIDFEEKENENTKTEK